MLVAQRRARLARRVQSAERVAYLWYWSRLAMMWARLAAVR
jgi:hypothetical protein